MILKRANKFQQLKKKRKKRRKIHILNLLVSMNENTTENLRFKTFGVCNVNRSELEVNHMEQ